MEAATAHDVAALLIQRQNASGNSIDKLQLEKFLYLVQGAHLELWGTPAFREPVEAWTRGPVVKVVEQTYRTATEGTEPLVAPLGGRPERLATDVVEVVDLVVSLFGKWSGPNLEHYTKRQGSPWALARGSLPLGEPSSMEIPIDEIARWFGRHGVNPSLRTTATDRDLFERAAAGDEDALSDLTR